MSKEQNEEFNATEKKILRLLFRTKANYTIYEVAKEVGISYPTAKKYCDRLTTLGIFDKYHEVRDKEEGKLLLRFRKDLLKEFLGLKKKYELPKNVKKEIEK